MPKTIRDPLSPEKVEQLLATYKDLGHIRKTAQAVGIHRDTVSKYLKKYRIASPRQYIADRNKSHMPKRVLYFTDAHDRIDWDKRRFEWLSLYARDHNPDAIVCGGDVFDVDSLNKHVRNETGDGKLKPAFEKELASLAEAFRAIDKHLPPGMPKYITLGNHEQRIWRYENDNPEVCGMLSSAFLCLLEHHKWQVTPFKQYLDLYGVEFTHVPINAMGREIGGKTAAMRIATDSVADIVYGHTHNRHDASAPKLGPNNRHTRAYNGGCFMPNGARMDYAKASQNHWEYGLTMFSIFGGRIEATSWVSVAQLERDYGKV